LGRGSHRSDDSSMGWRKTTFDGDVPGRRRRAVAGGDPEALMRLREGNETVRRGENKEEYGQRWRSPIEEDSGEGSPKSAVPGGDVDRR
jgi:hypothetical protein